MPRPSRRALALLVVVLVGVAAWVVWGRLSRAAAHDVRISWNPTCEGTRLSTHHGGPAIDSRAGWRCRAHVRIENASGHDVHLDEVHTELLGSGTGAEVRGFSGRAAPFEDVDEETGVPVRRGTRSTDGRWRLDTTIPAGGARTVVLTLGWAGRGCSSAGWFSIEDWPEVTFTVLGRERRASAQQDLVVHTLGHARTRPACR